MWWKKNNGQPPNSYSVEIVLKIENKIKTFLEKQKTKTLLSD